MNYGDWLNEWLNDYVKPAVKRRTYEGYRAIKELHIAPRLGKYDVSEITPLVLQKFVSELAESGNRKTGKGLSPNFIKAIISVAQNSLKTAYALGLTAEYTADKIKRPKIVEKQVDCFSPSEQRKIENYVLASKKPKLKGIIICLYTGLRIGELLALTWSDIDLKKASLTVNKTCYDGYVEGKRQIITDSPKTESSGRRIPIPKALFPILGTLKRENSDYVVSDKGKPVFVRSYQRSFELLLKKLGIPHKGFHSLRHTFATRAIECGMDIKSLSEILGHKNATVTLNRYAHSLWDHKAEMMNKLGKLLK